MIRNNRIPPISTTTSHLNSLNTNKTTRYDIGNPGAGLWLAQKLYLETLTIESKKLARTHISDVKLKVRGQWPQPFCHTDNPHAMGQNKVKG
jgi:hypothetical protein